MEYLLSFLDSKMDAWATEAQQRRRIILPTSLRSSASDCKERCKSNLIGGWCSVSKELQSEQKLTNRLVWGGNNTALLKR